MENNNKSQAEIYREERKARLAKAAAKNAKKSPKATQAKKIAGKVIAIVLAVVLVLGAVIGTLNFFGVPQKVLKVSVEEKSYSFTLAEYNYYYYTTWYQFMNTAYQYDTYYGAGIGISALGFDYQKSPDKQDYLDDYSAATGLTVEELGIENPTWSDVFKYATVNQIIQIKFGVQKAEEAGLSLTDDEIAEIDKSIETTRATAKKGDYSLSRFLHVNYGKGISEKLFRQIQLDSALASKYFTKLQEDTQNAVTDEQINERYNADKDAYNVADIRLYTFTTTADKNATKDEIAKAQAETKAKADAFLQAVTDEESFIAQAKTAILAADSKSTTDPDTSTKKGSQSFATLNVTSEELAKWVFDAARAVGDKTVIETSDGTYAVVLMTALPHKDTSISAHNVRHILVAFPMDDDGKVKEIKDEDKTEYYDEAKAILDEYLKNPTEENFAALAKKESDDTGSATNGGLIEGITPTSSYVKNFLDWSVDESRKVGDTDIVETEYGYHVMYYSSAEGETWYVNIKNEIFSENYNAVFDELTEKYIDTVNFNSFALKFATRDQNKKIANVIVNNYI
ncbi:MAG: peptidylprolyl isomerase [Oscillospiraceae bacterium]|nr:peptidylprolyl isomerase [Oscillospiraceae bacterium]